MKKIIAKAIISLTALSLCACGEAKADSLTTQTDTTEEVTETYEEPVITGEVVEEKNIDISWYEADSSIMLQGVYETGKDIDAGNYIFTCISEYVDVTVFEDKDAYINYHIQPRFTIGENNEARDANAKYHEFLYKDDYYALNVTDGNIILIEDGYGSVSGGSSQNLSVDQMLCNGLYEAGTIPVGKYAVGCADSKNSGVELVVFENPEKYADFDVAEKFTNGEWSTAEEKNAYYSIYLEVGDLCYIDVTKDTVILVDSQGILNMYLVNPALSATLGTEDEKISDEEEAEAEVSKEAETADENLIRPEFKAAMDEYEKFYDEYCDFMSKYTNSNDPMDSVNMLGDYSKMLLQMEEMDKMFEEWDSKDMTTAETAYYIDVTARIQKKLLSVTQ